MNRFIVGGEKLLQFMMGMFPTLGKDVTLYCSAHFELRYSKGWRRLDAEVDVCVRG